MLAASAVANLRQQSGPLKAELFARNGGACAFISNLDHVKNAKVRRPHALWNGLDVLNPSFAWIRAEDPIRRLKVLSGRPIGANLEPVDAIGYGGGTVQCLLPKGSDLLG